VNDDGQGLAGLTVVALESRRAEELARLLRHHGATPVSAPSMREVPIEENAPARRWAERLLAGEIDVHVCLTGVGTRALFAILGGLVPREDLVAALARVVLVARGPKPVAALREVGLVPTIRVPEPNTWREVLAALDARGSVEGRRVSVQEYGVPNLELLRGLDERGAEVLQVPAYRWALPEDTRPLRAAVHRIAAGDVDVVLFTTARQVEHLLGVAAEEGVADAVLATTRTRSIVASIGPSCSAGLRRAGFPVDFEPSHPKMGVLVHELAAEAGARLAAKRATPVLTPSIAPQPDASGEEPPVVRALRREPLDVTPVWLMRQAGRYLPSYRAIRASVPLLELCKRPTLASEVTVDAVTTLGVDAAIVFSDLLLPLEAMGAHVEFVPGAGPQVADPIRESEDVDRIVLPEPGALACVAETIRLARAALPRKVAMLGFAGAPFTLASYLIEGGTSRTYEHTKLLMHRDPAAWRRLLDVLAQAATSFLSSQIDAGADAVQLFDTAVGGLGPDDYRAAVLPHVRAVIAGVRAAHPRTPIILFGTGCAGLLPAMRESEADAFAIDWRIDLDAAWSMVGHDRAVQGNLDPAVLFADPAVIERRARGILAAAAGRPGHVFNLGHGILPRTPVDAVRRLVDVVHETPPAFGRA